MFSWTHEGSGDNEVSKQDLGYDVILHFSCIKDSKLEVMMGHFFQAQWDPFDSESLHFTEQVPVYRRWSIWILNLIMRFRIR